MDVLDLAEAGVVQVYTSENALAELYSVLSRAKFRYRLRSLGISASSLVSAYRRLATVVAPADPPGICSDLQDDEFIAIGISAEADVIASGDRHLLACSESSPIPILTVAELLLALRDILKPDSE